MHYSKIFKSQFFEFWNLLFFLAGFFFIIQHIFLGFYHFHECDSSILYDYLKDQPLINMNYFINNFSPDVFTNIRLWLAKVSIEIPFLPLKKFIQLPYVSTYTPLMGLFFGGLSNETYKWFYYFSSLINGFVLLLTSTIFYLTNIKLNISKPISFFFASLLLTFYATNSYSYHLGSTIWYLLSISLGIYILLIENKILKDLSSAILTFLSYPYILWYFSELFIIIIFSFYNKKLNFKFILDTFINLFKGRFLTIISIFLNIVLFFPVNSGYRGGPDIRGLYTIFSFEPLNNINNNFAIIFSIILYMFLLLGVLSFRNTLMKFFTLENFNFKNKSLLKVIDFDNRSLVFLHCFSFIFIVMILVIVRKLSFTTSRHSIFIIPSLLLLISFGAEEFIKKIKNKFDFNLNKFITPLIISFISFTFFISTNSNLQRIDILKSNNIPSSINDFVKSNNDITYSIIGCSPHYKYANFDEKRINYNKKISNKLSNLYSTGKKLVISQRPIISKKKGEFDNEFTQYLFFDKPSFGDTINVKSKKVKIKIIGKPFISKTSIYYDSLNKNSKIYNLFHSFRILKTFYINKFKPSQIMKNNSNNLEIYNWYDFYTKSTGEEYRYPRPNDIWLIPIEVEKLN